MMWSHGSIGWTGWIVMTVGMLAFWYLVIWVVLAMFRGGTPNPPEQPQPDPLRLLDERFARGEIDTDDYHARKQALRSSASTRTSAR